jgi:hypothetical protein
VTWDDDCFVGKREEAIVNGGQEFAGVAAGQVGAADGAGEERVAGEKEGLAGKIEADGAFGVTWGVEDGAGDAASALGGVGSYGDEFAVVEGVVRVLNRGGGDA